jgi:hypothetical protein
VYREEVQQQDQFAQYGYKGEYTFEDDKDQRQLSFFGLKDGG